MTTTQSKTTRDKWRIPHSRWKPSSHPGLHYYTNTQTTRDVCNLHLQNTFHSVSSWFLCYSLTLNHHVLAHKGLTSLKEGHSWGPQAQRCLLYSAVLREKANSSLFCYSLSLSKSTSKPFHSNKDLLNVSINKIKWVWINTFDVHNALQYIKIPFHHFFTNRMLLHFLSGQDKIACFPRSPSVLLLELLVRQHLEKRHAIRSRHCYYIRLRSSHISPTTQDDQLSTKHCNCKMNYWK